MARRRQPEPRPAQRLGFIVTDIIRLAGVAVVGNEVFIETTVRTPAIAIAALMLTGAESLEMFLASFGGGKR